MTGVQTCALPISHWSNPFNDRAFEGFHIVRPRTLSSSLQLSLGWASPLAMRVKIKITISTIASMSSSEQSCIWSSKSEVILRSFLKVSCSRLSLFAKKRIYSQISVRKTLGYDFTHSNVDSSSGTTDGFVIHPKPSWTSATMFTHGCTVRQKWWP